MRTIEPGDQERISQIHSRMQFDYKMPDLADPLFLVKRGFAPEGQLQMCAGVRLEGECYLWLDPAWNAFPEEKMAVFRVLHDEVCAESARKGLDQLVLYMPPELYARRAFPRRLNALGWAESRPWPRFARQL